MIIVALLRPELEALRAGDLGVCGPAFAVTPAMLAAHDYGPADTEEAEYATLTYACIAALTRGGRRWVAALDLPAGSSASPYGLIDCPALHWRAVTALFTDEPGATGPLAELSRRIADRPLDAVLAEPDVLDIVEDFDLLWYAPEELDRIE